jgi:hypothetical protein
MKIEENSASNLEKENWESEKSAIKNRRKGKNVFIRYVRRDGDEVSVCFYFIRFVFFEIFL